MKKKSIILLTIISFFASNLFAQDIDNYTIYADSLFSARNTENALNAYRRILFFDTNNKQNQINLKIADCYLALKNYDSAIEVLDSILLKTNDKIIVKDALKKKTTACILASYLPQAYIILLSSDSLYFDEKELCFYKAMCYFKNDEIKFSEKYFLKSAETSETKAKLDSIFEKKSNLYRPSPFTAKVLSAFVPGAGQAYSGDIKNSLNALFLNVALGYLTYKTAVAYSIFDSAISVFPWFFRYYKGNIKKAGEISTRKRTEKRQEILNEIISIIASEKKSDG